MGSSPRYALYLADTPGFDNTDISDAAVLERIAAWLSEIYRDGVKLAGIIYLHRISDDHLTRSALRSLSMLGKLVGLKHMRNVTLLTTRWEEVSCIFTSHSGTFILDVLEAYQAYLLGICINYVPVADRSNYLASMQTAEGLQSQTPKMWAVAGTIEGMRGCKNSK